MDGELGQGLGTRGGDLRLGGLEGATRVPAEFLRNGQRDGDLPGERTLALDLGGLAVNSPVVCRTCQQGNHKDTHKG